MNRHFTYPEKASGRADRFPRWLIVGLVLACVAFAPTMMPGPGLTSPQPMKKFLNGTLPVSTPNQVIGYEVVEAFPNMLVDSTLVFTPEPGTNRIIIGSRQGYYEAFENDPAVTTAQKQPFLDLRARTAGVWDGGNLGMTYHPNYPTQPYIYIWYCARVEGRQPPTKAVWGSSENTFQDDDVFLRLSRFTIEDDVVTGDKIANKASEFVMINVHLYNSSHRGGGMAWDDDGNLLVTMGEQFTSSTAQVITSNFQGGWIRIDVDQRGGAISHIPKRVVQNDPTYNPGGTTIHGFTNPNHYIGNQAASESEMADPVFLANPDKEFTGRGYYIPNDNPDWGALAAAKGVTLNDGDYFEEYCTIGNRNPHRMTRDGNGRYWSGEVGAGSREEINVLEEDELSTGINFGWPAKEGNQGSYNNNYFGTQKDPATDFTRSESNAIMGGYVYRGTELPSLVGKYICGGYSQKRIFAVSYDEDANGHVTNITREEIANFTPGSLITFGQDHNGELYLCRQGDNTKIYKLQAIGSAVPAPPLLSDIDVFNTNGSGDFAGIPSLTPKSGLIPYDLNVPFWSDGALKYRYLAVPNDEDDNGIHDKSDEKIIFSENGEWQFPPGTVFVKHFELPLDETSPVNTQRIETRFVVHGDDGNYYYITYKWRDDESNADLLEVGMEKDFTINTATGTRIQTWQYPSRTECQQCHNEAAGNVLGANTRQLNRDLNYASLGGTTGNQIETYNNLDMFSGTPFQVSEIQNFLTLSEINGSDPLEDRARSYLDANCSYCHRPGTGNRGVFDARFTTPLEFQNLVYGPLNVDLEDSENRVITPQDVPHSVAHTRMNSTTPGIAMPPLARNVVDMLGTTLIADWIGTLDVDFAAPCAGLQADYFNNTDLSGTPVLTQIVPTVNFNYGSGSPDPLVNADNFSTRFSGTVLPPETGTYTFYATADDGVRLYVNGVELFTGGWVPQGGVTYTGTASLTQGVETDIVLEHYEATGGALIQLEWSYGTTPREVIPQTSLCIGDGTTLAQSINFPVIEDRCVGDPAFDLNATATSGLPVSYSIITGDQYINITDGTVTIDEANITGMNLTLPVTITIQADQAGDATYDPAAPVSQSFDLIDGSGASFNLVTNGVAARDGCSDCYIITPDVGDAAGTAWSDFTLDLDQSFRLTFTVNLGATDGGGGDGMTFALQNAGTGFLGSNGTPMAVNGMTPSFGVEFDTYQSTGSFDPPEDHISFWDGGDVTSPLQTPVQASATATNIENNVDYPVIIEWDPLVNQLSVEFDGVVRDVYNGDIRASFGVNPQAYFGFGAGTGGATNEHKACLVSLEQGITFFNLVTTKTDENCDLSDGTATVTPSGGVPPYSYTWSANAPTPVNDATSSTISGLGADTYDVTVMDSDNPVNTKVASIAINNIPGPSLATSSTDSDCGQSNGTVTVTPTSNGGTDTYTYLWDANAGSQATATATGLAGGTYSVTVTEGGVCESITTVVVTETAPFSLSFDTTNPPNVLPTCGNSDGIVTVSAPGATGTLTYLWDANAGGQTTAQATGLSAGTYFVTVTEDGVCQASGSVTIGQTGCPTLTTNGTATADGGDCYTLTTTTPNNQAGTIWSEDLLDLNSSFVLEGNLYFGNDVSGNNQGGADGIAFALQKDSRGTAAIGGYGGSYAISLPNGTQAVSPSFGVEFDTYPNSGEPTSDHLSFFGNGNVYLPLQTEVDASSTGANIEDAAFHPVRFEWDAQAMTMSVYFDNVLRDTYTGDIVTNFFGGDNLVYWGFGGGTGGATNLQQFCFTSLEIGASAMMLDVAQTNANCGQSDGSTTVTVTGGTPPYAFQWSANAPASVDDTQNGTSTISNLSADTYTLTVTDGNTYTANASVTITDIPGPTVDITVDQEVTCGLTDGQVTASATANGGSTNFVSYQWDDPLLQQTATATGLAPGVLYTVVVTDDNGCTGTQSVTLADPVPPFTVGLTKTDETSCNAGDGTVKATVTGTGTFDIEWFDSGNNSLGSQIGVTELEITGLSVGTYTAVVIDPNGCTVSDDITVESPCPTLSTAGTATDDGGNCFILTTESPTSQAGAIWSDDFVNLNNRIVLTGSIYLGSGGDAGANQDRADGMTFAFQADPAGVAALGGIGTGMAVSGVSPSFGAEFDTYPGGAYDITADHIAFWANGAVTSPLQTPVPIVDASDVEIDVEADGTFYPIIIEWNPDLLEFTVTFDGVLQDTYNGDIRSFFPDPTQVRWGFGAGTGGKVNLQQFCFDNLVITQPSFEVSVAGTDANCGQDDGSATATPSGGTTPYIYTWSAGTLIGDGSTVEDLPIGTHTVSVTDDNGVGSLVVRTVTIGDIPGPTVTTSSENATCNIANGTATANTSANGGSTDFTYNWSAGTITTAPDGSTSTASDLPGGPVTVTVTDGNGCEVIETISIGETAVFTLSMSSTDTECGGATGSATVVVNQGFAPPITVDWDAVPGTPANSSESEPTTVTDLGAGTYSVTVTDNVGCEVIGTVDVEETGCLDLVTPIGDASSNGSDCYTITQDLEDQAGAIWSNTQIDLTEQFRLEAVVNMGTKDGGADGMTFAFHNDSRGTSALAKDGGDFGISASTGGFTPVTPSFGIEFDGYNNGAGDIGDDHTAVWANGDVFSPIVGPTSFGTDTEDGVDRNVVIEWDPGTQTIDMYFAGALTPTISYTGDIINNFFGGNSLVYWGFSGGTGGLSNLQTVCILDLETTPCPDVTVEVSVFLEGPFESGTGLMNNNLRTNLGAAFPLTDPYGQGETVGSLPGGVDVVDWVLVELRNPLDNTAVLSSRACFVDVNGDVYDTDGSLGVTFTNICATEAYIAVKHRNHLSIMTDNPVPLVVVP